MVRVLPLYSRLFARHNKGEFVLRIKTPISSAPRRKQLKAIMDGMNWLNLQWDEESLLQTKR